MSTVLNNNIVPRKEMPIIQVDSSVLLSLIDKTKKLTEELEKILQQQTNSSVQSKTIIVRKPIDLLREIEKNEDEDAYDQLLRLVDALSIYEKSGDKIGNDFKHLFEKIFVKNCLKLKENDEKEIQGCIGLNTVFLSSVVKVRDIKWLLYLITIYHGEEYLFQFNKEHAEMYAKIGSRDCQILMNKLVKDSNSNQRLIYDMLINTLIIEKNLEECKKLISYGASIYRDKNTEYCCHSNLEECYRPFKKNQNCTEAFCFRLKYYQEIIIIKTIIDKLGCKDDNKDIEYIKWIIYTYPSRLGYIIKVEKEGKEHLYSIIKDYCEKNNKTELFNKYKTL